MRTGLTRMPVSSTTIGPGAAFSLPRGMSTTDQTDQCDAPPGESIRRPDARRRAWLTAHGDGHSRWPFASAFPGEAPVQFARR
jgi:hypothetical protein